MEGKVLLVAHTLYALFLEVLLLHSVLLFIHDCHQTLRRFKLGETLLTLAKTRRCRLHSGHSTIRINNLFFIMDLVKITLLPIIILLLQLLQHIDH